MKRILLIITILFTANSLFAQNINLGIQGGVNMASINPTAPQNGAVGSQSHATFQIGATFDIKFKSFTLQPGVLLTGKGNTSTSVENLVSNKSPVPYYATYSTNISYVEVPVNVVYQHTTKLGALYLGAGPYIAKAIWGSYTRKMNINEYYKRAETTDVTFGNSDDQLKSIDYGANILGGIVLNNGMKLGVNYGWGFSNITNTGPTSQNRVLSVIIGFSFK